VTQEGRTLEPILFNGGNFVADCAQSDGNGYHLKILGKGPAANVYYSEEEEAEIE